MKNYLRIVSYRGNSTIHLINAPVVAVGSQFWNLYDFIRMNLKDGGVGRNGFRQGRRSTNPHTHYKKENKKNVLRHRHV